MIKQTPYRTQKELKKVSNLRNQRITKQIPLETKKESITIRSPIKVNRWEKNLLHSIRTGKRWTCRGRLFLPTNKVSMLIAQIQSVKFVTGSCPDASMWTYGGIVPIKILRLLFVIFVGITRKLLSAWPSLWNCSNASVEGRMLSNLSSSQQMILLSAQRFWLINSTLMIWKQKRRSQLLIWIKIFMRNGQENSSKSIT